MLPNADDRRQADQKAVERLQQFVKDHGKLSPIGFAATLFQHGYFKDLNEDVLEGMVRRIVRTTDLISWEELFSSQA